ncbi:MAG: glycoside hydrolase family 9 protein [Verrucomicrobiae bacterium]
MKSFLSIGLAAGCLLAGGEFAIANQSAWGEAAVRTEVQALRMPRDGDHGVRVLSPEWLELTRVYQKVEKELPPKMWDFTDDAKRPVPGDFEVTVGGKPVAVAEVGFKRRVLYAPLKVRDLRVGNWLYLKLTSPVPEGAEVKVTTRRGDVIFPGETWSVKAEPWRYSPALHVNQDAYPAEGTKMGYAGFYLGSPGELVIAERKFALVDLATGEKAFEGDLAPRLDSGFGTPSYQNVLAADFSAFTKPGHYVLSVAGLGASLPFWIDPSGAGLMARSYALGIYGQRDGAPGNLLPYTRHTHGPAHAAPARVMTAEDEHNKSISGTSADAVKNPRHTAPIMKSIADSLYPYVKSGEVDVSGGHHDAGDYSKYTINSASFIHSLVFAADALPGVAGLDNLGTPESGDGISDVIQLAKWEADFLVKMQDDDGGFFFIVYPEKRKYEDDVTPDDGDRQVVYPKNTAGTAAAVAALAQAGTSPAFKKAYPQEAAKYLEAAKKGWKFLRDAIAKHGRDGAYQKITHYGDLFMHDDELAWAAVQMFLATGDAKIQGELIATFDPESRDVKRWGWWRLPESYGNALRSYVFGARNGLLPAEKFDAAYLEKCKAELVAGAEDEMRRADESAYGLSFPGQSKAFMNAGWFFAGDRCLDLAVGQALAPKPEYLRAIASNLGFESGANPINMPRMTGIGAYQQRDITHQHSQNDWRELPVPGIPLGALQGGFMWIHQYQRELGQLSWPPDGGKDAYALYDRWGDSFNTLIEFVNFNQARGMAASAMLMAMGPDQPWKPVDATIEGMPKKPQPGTPITLKIQSPVDLSKARIIWEASGHEIFEGAEFVFTPKNAGDFLIEADALLPDGRRVFAAIGGRVHQGEGGKPALRQPSTLVLLDFDKPLTADTIKAAAGFEAEIAGSPTTSDKDLLWMESPSGAALKLTSFNDRVKIHFPDSITTGFKLSAWIKIRKVPYGNAQTASPTLLAIEEGRDNTYGLVQDKWVLYPGGVSRPRIRIGNETAIPTEKLAPILTLGDWHFLEIEFSAGTATVTVDRKEAARMTPAKGFYEKAPKALVLGHFIGLLDDVHLETR